MANSNKFSGGAVELTGTAQPGDVLKNSTFYNTTDEKLIGTLELTGNVTPNDVAVGKSFYSNNAKVKQTGALPVIYSGKGKSLYVSTTGKAYISSIEEGIYKDNGDGQGRPDVWIDSNLLGDANELDVVFGKTFSSKAGGRLTGVLKVLKAIGFTNVPDGNWVIRTGTKSFGEVNGDPNLIPLEAYVGFSQLAGTAYHEVKYGNTILNDGMEYSGGHARCFCGINLTKQQLTQTGCHTYHVTTWLEKTGGVVKKLLSKLNHFIYRNEVIMYA